MRSPTLLFFFITCRHPGLTQYVLGLAIGKGLSVQRTCTCAHMTFPNATRMDISGSRNTPRVTSQKEKKMASDLRVKSLEDVKKEIRALLISTKHGCTPKQLQNDYLQVMGENLPFHCFGYTNLMSFVQSMPDVVSVCLSRNNTILYGVSNSKTKKIHDLVAKQKNSHKGPSGWTTVPPRMNMVTKNSAPPPHKDPVVPSPFKIRLKELMLSYPNGILLNVFNEAFAKRFHYYIAYQNWGFESIEGMIASVPDILFINDDATRNVKIVKRSIRQERVKDQDTECQTQENRGVLAINWYSLEKERKKSVDYESSMDPKDQAESE